jgi:hypothetical protein
VDHGPSGWIEGLVLAFRMFIVHRSSRIVVSKRESCELRASSGEIVSVSLKKFLG